MSNISILIICVMGFITAAEIPQLPPQGGKFFYSDLRSGQISGMHYIDVLVGEPQKHFQLALTSGESTAGLVSVACSASICYVADRFDHTLSQTCVAAGWSAIERTLLFNHKALAWASFTTRGFKDVFTFELFQYQRETQFTVDFAAVTESAKAFSSEFDGHIGFAPYSQNLAEKERNFMYQLKENKIIEHNIVSIYSRIIPGAAGGNSSFVKFGGWDQKALADGVELKMFRTVNSSSWNLKTGGFKLGTQALLGVNGQPLKGREIQINPHLPYLYLPDEDWKSFADALTKVHLNDVDKPICSYFANSCYFDKPCAQLSASDNHLKITIFQDQAQTKAVVLDIDEKDLRIEAAAMGVTGSQANRCYVPIFRHKLDDRQTVWQGGSTLLEKQYVVFDMTPYDERQQDYIQIGIGLQDTYPVVLQRHYAHASSGYSPEAQASDSSKPLPGAVNAYDHAVPTPPTPVPFVPDNKPIVATNETSIAADGTVTEPANVTDAADIEVPHEGLLKEEKNNDGPVPDPNTPKGGSGGVIIGLIIGAIVIIVVIGVAIKMKGNQGKNKTFATGAAARQLVADEETEDAEQAAAEGVQSD